MPQQPATSKGCDKIRHANRVKVMIKCQGTNQRGGDMAEADLTGSISR